VLVTNNKTCRGIGCLFS